MSDGKHNRNEERKRKKGAKNHVIKLSMRVYCYCRRCSCQMVISITLLRAHVRWTKWKFSSSFAITVNHHAVNRQKMNEQFERRRKILSWKLWFFWDSHVLACGKRKRTRRGNLRKSRFFCCFFFVACRKKKQIILCTYVVRVKQIT